MSVRENTTVTIYVPIRLIDHAAEVARRRGVSRNRLVVEAIRAAVEREAACLPAGKAADVELRADGGQQESEVRDETQ